MTYHTLRCPHCKKVIGRATGSPSFIGNPLKQCPLCGGIYVDPFTEEWANKTKRKRIKYLIDKPIASGFLSLIAITVLLAAVVTVDIFVSLIIGAIIAVAIAFLSYFLCKSTVQEEIEKSIKRTQNANYVKQLKQAGLEIYPIKGVEIGTETSDNELFVRCENIKEGKDKFYTLH